MCIICIANERQCRRQILANDGSICFIPLLQINQLRHRESLPTTHYLLPTTRRRRLCAANKPDSVHALRRSSHSSKRSTRNLTVTPRRTDWAGSPFDSLFDLAPGRVCPACVVSGAPVVSCTAISPLPLRAVCSLWHFPSRRIALRLPTLTDGSPALWSPDFPHPCGRDRSLAQNRQKSKIAIEHAAAVRAGHQLHPVVNHLLR